MGVYLDNLLSWKKHLDVLSIKLRKANGIISKLRHFVSRSVLLQIYFAFFDSHMRYACQVWGNSPCLRIFRLQKQCMRLITFSEYRAPSSNLFRNLGILKLPDLVKLLNVTNIHRILTNSAHPALINTYNLNRYPSCHNTRGNLLGLLTRPQCNTTRFGLNSVIYQSIVEWNELQLQCPESELSIISRHKLIKLYKSIIFNSY